jgi:Tol biopolymer transport system component
MSPSNRNALLIAVAVGSFVTAVILYARFFHAYPRSVGIRPSMSPDGSSVLYATPRTGHGDIYRVSRDGSQTQRLTNGPACECDPAYSPDGSKIAFIREQDHVGHIWMMDPDGSSQRQLTHDRGADYTPALSPDGSLVVFTRYVEEWKYRPATSQSAELFVVNVDGSNETRLTYNECRDSFASFSPDGKRIVFERECRSGDVGIWVMDAHGSNPRRLGAGRSPSFSPDGRQIAFTDDRNTPYQWDIFLMDADGGSVSQLTADGGRKHYLSFCLGGKALLFLAEQSPRAGTLRLLHLEEGKTEDIATME